MPLRHRLRLRASHALAHDRAKRALREDHTLIAADAGYHSDANVQYLKDHSIAAMIADNQMRYQTYTAKAVDCNACEHIAQCLKGPLKPDDGRGRQVTRFEPKTKDLVHPSERMRQAIDSPRGRHLYSQRIGTVEPVFGNIRYNKRLTRLNYRGYAKVIAQWNLYCMVHNIEKLSKTEMGRNIQ